MPRPSELHLLDSGISDVAPASAAVEFRAGPKSAPYLADHGLHDMVLLPGSYCLELVRQAHRQLFAAEASRFRRMQFEKPVLLSQEDDAAITVRVEKLADGAFHYRLFETGEADDPANPRPFAHLLVDAESSALPEEAPAPFHPEEFPDDAQLLGESGELYRRLQANGNQYGPHFQSLGAVWKTPGGEFVARMADGLTTRGEAHAPLSVLLDAGVQLLGVQSLDAGRTFLLQSIEHARLTTASAQPTAPAQPRWLRARPSERATSGIDISTGNVEFFDAAGNPVWQLTGVRLAFIDPPARTAAVPAEEMAICLAATFTAEPIEDALRFWGQHFGAAVRLDFAPYNQVFQQLLAPESAFHRNREGLNVVLLDLADWLPKSSAPALSADPKRLAEIFGPRPRCTLRNGLEIVHLNSYETDYVYQEIFEDECYLRHGIELRDGDTVVDIGANIGLFSLFVLSRCENARIYAYEPSPRVFDLLQANCAAYGGGRVRAFPCGVAESPCRQPFTFYEHSSVFSSFHPDEEEDRAAVQAVVRNVLAQEFSENGAVADGDVEELTAHRLQAQTIDCELTSVSEIIRKNGLTHIHLLKVDAEKCELGILRGIAEEHWPSIDQIVIEVHGRTRESVGEFEEILARRGYRCAVEEENLLEGSGLFNVYATRRAASTATPAADAGAEFDRKVGEFCTALGAFSTAASAPMILAVTPRTGGRHAATAEAAEERVLACAAGLPHVRALSSKAIRAQYPVAHWHDPESQRLGHIPFTPEGFAALGTAISRVIYQLSSRPIKVIALDADHTLWQGACGEDGPLGVVVSPPFQRLQQFMMAQAEAGVLLVLCSKNIESDVLAVFDQNKGMILRREHLAAWRINWQEKSENLAALAARLNLGLGSFVFLDDNPRECAAVRAWRPEVTVLQLPADVERIPTFLESLWLFDRRPATSEDRARGPWYRANVEREELRAATPTLREFLDGLELCIETTEADEDELERIAQLTVRTNQFNFTSARHSADELRALRRSGVTCLATRVRDRFGDYGLVGAMLFEKAGDGIRVHNVLLSCRALGKGVEHRMLSELGRRALNAGQTRVHMTCRESGRNEPALVFFASLGAVERKGSELTVEVSAARLAALCYSPDEQAAPATSAREENRAPATGGQIDSADWQQLGEELTDIDSIVAAIHRAQPTPAETAAEPAEPGSNLEHALAAIWKKALGRSQIGYDEGFFDAGGTSLKAVMVVAMIRKQLKKPVSIVSLFECPTIRLFAARLEEPGEARSASTAAAEARGRQRRQKFMKRGGRAV